MSALSPTQLLTCDVGDTIEFEATFTDKAGAVYDPVTVAAYTLLRSSAARRTALTPITKVSTGVYTALFSAAEPGIYAVRFEGTSPLAAVSGTVTVRPDPTA